MSVNKIQFDDRIKPKNILALNEKVAAIRRYEIEPVYKKIGRMFNCSPDQIKRIVKQKDEILAEWENRTKKYVPPTKQEIKSVRISFLGKAVHEWIRRIMYYTDFNLNDTLIQTMTLEFSKVLGLVSFYPTKEWIANFRNTYNLADANTKTMNIGYQESHSVQIRDILHHVKEVCGTRDVTVEDQDQSKSNTGGSTNEDGGIFLSGAQSEIKTEDYITSEFYGDVVMKSEAEDETCEPSCSKTVQSLKVPEETPVFTVSPNMLVLVPQKTPVNTNLLIPLETSVNTNLLIPLETSVNQNLQIPLETSVNPNLLIPLETSVNSLNQTEPEVKTEDEPEKVAIYSHEAAINCVKLLEEFALLKENFRLIGLIERLEEALNEKS